MSPESMLKNANKREPALIVSSLSAGFPFSLEMPEPDEPENPYKMYEDERDYELGEGD